MFSTSELVKLQKHFNRVEFNLLKSSFSIYQFVVKLDYLFQRRADRDLEQSLNGACDWYNINRYNTVLKDSSSSSACLYPTSCGYGTTYLPLPFTSISRHPKK